MFRPMVTWLRIPLDRLRNEASFSNQVSRTFVTNLTVLGLNLVAGVFLARLLGPTGRGELAAVRALPMILAGFAMFGLQDAIVFFGGRDRARVGRYAVSGTALILLMGSPLLVVGALLMPAFLDAQRGGIVSASRVFLLVFVAHAIAGVALFTARACEEVRLWNRLRMLPAVLWTALIAGFVVAGRADPVAIALVYLASYIALSLLMVLPVVRHLRGHLVPRPGTWRPMLRYGLPLAAGNSPLLLGQRLDQLLIAGVLPPDELGLYSVAVSWSSVLGMPVLALSAIAFPRLAGTLDPAAQRRFFVKGIAGAVGSAVAAFVLLALAAPVVIPLVFTPAFSGAVNLALVLLAGAACRSISTMLYAGMKGLGKPSTVMYAEWAGLIVLGLALYGSVPRFGSVGAAWSVVAANLASLSVGATIVARHLRAGGSQTR